MLCFVERNLEVRCLDTLSHLPRGELVMARFEGHGSALVDARKPDIEHNRRGRSPKG